jgi:hypothetical protein
MDAFKKKKITVGNTKAILKDYAWLPNIKNRNKLFYIRLSLNGALLGQFTYAF